MKSISKLKRKYKKIQRKRKVKKMGKILNVLVERRKRISTIKLAGNLNHIVKIDYQRKSDRTTLNYIIEPYSERKGNRLFAYKRNKGKSGSGIRGFIKSNIKNVEVLERKFKPRYKVEF